MTRFRKAFLNGVLLTMATILGLPVCRAQQSKEPPSPKTLDELRAAMMTVLEREHVPGAGIALIQNGELLWCGGIGKADLKRNLEVTCDTEFRAGSISKTFVALALLKLQEEGKINLQARLADVAPEVRVRNPWNATNPVRIVNLLEHTAGFDDMTFSEIYNLHDPHDFPLLQVFERFPKPQRVRWRPGTRMSYSNPGYGVVGYVIEKVTGRPFDEYVREAILRPLGMERADFRLTDANRSLLATGYSGNPLEPVGYPNIYLRPAGDLRASPGELAKVVQFFLRRGKAGDNALLTPGSIARMEYPQTTLAARAGLRDGYGFGNYTDFTGGVVTHGHDGGIDGFISSYRYMPEQNWGYVILINRGSSGGAIFELKRLASEFLSQGLPKPQQPIVPLPAAQLEKFAGYYAPRAPRSQAFAFMDDLVGRIRVRAGNGRLSRSGMFGKPEALLPVTSDSFRAESDPEASTIFVPGEDGRMVMSAVGGGSYAERVSPIWPWARLILLSLSLLLMASSPLFALVWGLRLLLRQMAGVKHFAVRVVPLLAVLSLGAVVLCASRVGGPGLGTLSFWSLGVFLSTLLLPLFSIAGLWLALRVSKEEIRRGVRVHSLLVALACCCVSGFFAAWHLIGFRFWA